jgi:hypothetical protein
LKGWGYNLADNKKKRKQKIERLIMEVEEKEESGLVSQWISLGGLLT